MTAPSISNVRGRSSLAAFAFSVFASGQGKAVVADGPNYLDMSRFGFLAVEENEVVG